MKPMMKEMMPEKGAARHMEGMGKEAKVKEVLAKMRARRKKR